MSRPGLLCFLQILSVITRTDGYYHSRMAKCSFSSSDFSDMEYTDSVLFGKRIEYEFKSSLGKYVGYTEAGMKGAEFLNNSTRLQEMRAQMDTCKGMATIRISRVMGKTVSPKVQLRSVREAENTHVSTLMCSAYEFYPSQIEVYWLRDGKKMTGGVSSTEELADGDWHYQIHSYLQYSPAYGEKISCVVEHISFKEPMIYEWDSSLPNSDKIKIALGVCAFVLGTVMAAAGLINYKKKSTGRIRVSQLESSQVTSLSGTLINWSQTNNQTQIL